MVTLGSLEGKQLRTLNEPARHWYQQAISTGQVAQAGERCEACGVRRGDQAILTRPGTGIEQAVSSVARLPREEERCLTSASGSSLRAFRPGPGLVEQATQDQRPRRGTPR